MDMTAFTNDKDTIECLSVLYDLFITVGGLRDTTASSVQAEVGAAMVSLLITLPNNKVWQANASSCVPTLRSLASHVKTTAHVLNQYVTNERHVSMLQARMFHFSIDLLIECVAPLLDKEAHIKFAIALYAEMAVLTDE